MTFRIRAARLDDAERIAQVHVAAWQWAYVGVMPHEVLARLDVGASAERWRRILTPPGEPGATHLVAEDDRGEIQAISTVGPYRERAGPDDPGGELWMLNAHPDAFGTGAATALHAAALERLRALGHDDVALWVAERNPRARRFYEREGWRPDGARRDDVIGGATVTEVRYRRSPV